jgi:serine/threonine-protein kinase
MDEPSTSFLRPPTEPTPEKRIGSYRILSPLGTGGMSSVFRAIHVETGHEVALKVLTRSLARNSILLQRFLREARSAETLQHPNIVAIYDRGTDQGRHYLVLEYVAGGDFHDRIQGHGPLSTAEAVRVVKSVAAGLAYAATRGLIHRDIKPSNILRTPDGQIKIIDLGLALQNEFEDERVTREGTTVGTVDYMAPEQARDSRATSIQSDVYSLGCTFYYLLTGVPPFPGGDITDKLTRHAKTPPPAVRDLRPDVPAGINAAIKIMMAKQPQDRYASYDDLLVALDAVPLDETEQSAGIALVPLESETELDRGVRSGDAWPARDNGRSGEGRSADAVIPMQPLAELVANELPGELLQRSPARAAPAERPAPLLRQNSIPVQVAPILSAEPDVDEREAPTRKPSSAVAWIIPGACVGFAFVILAIGLLQLMSWQPGRDAVAALRPAHAANHAPAFSPERDRVRPRPAPAGSEPQNRGLSTSKRALEVNTPLPWREPEDSEPVAVVDGAPLLNAAAAARYLPDWARAPIAERANGPFVVVRRAADQNDSTALPTLHAALDGHIGRTVELADEGPLPADDLRFAGESRSICARPGFRPIIRIEHSSLETVRRQSAVFVLDRKSLTLDGVDLVVNVDDLSPSQTALFSCIDANLTLRNCSIAVLNRRGVETFTLIRTESNGSRPTRVHVENSLARGSFGVGIELGRGPTDIVLNESMVLGGGGPLFRIADAKSASERRIWLVNSLLAGTGPVVEVASAAAGLHARTPVVRAFGSVFGRLLGDGIASVISVADSSASAGSQIDWAGEKNLFAGWKGFLASGDDHTITIPDLAVVRSTWNGTDRDSQEIFAPWPHPGDLAWTPAERFRPYLPSHDAFLRRVAQPRAGLFEKTMGAYPSPVIPEPLTGEIAQPARPGVVSVPARNVRAPMRKFTPVPPGTPPLASTPPATELTELTFHTQAPPWHGDLGAFLRDALPSRPDIVRVRVTGSGQHHFTPVRLQDGLRLELRVEADSGAEPPSWSPAPAAAGPALIELHGGALVLSNLVLHPQADARIDNLIRIEDGHLVLSRCQLTAPPSGGTFTGDLIEFRSVTTRPFPSDPLRPLFSAPVDRPVCRAVDSVLITGGRALKAELGRGLVALSQCAIAAGVAALELSPSKVARARFEADLSLDRCTLTSERSIIRLGPWPGLAPGPDRPWLISSRQCVFLSMYERKARETALVRADADALASGTFLWQAVRDVVDVDFFIAAGDGGAPTHRTRDLQLHWVNFWGPTHMDALTGPRAGGGPPVVRFTERLRPGRVEPAHLILVGADLRPNPDLLDVGADLSRLGIAPLPPRYGRTRN